MPRSSNAPGNILAIGIFVFVWLTRFTDPGGSFAGLTDDHFFYLVRGWQILFGDLPVRDFVDHGAPLFYYVGAAVQILFGRGTLSEVAFCVTVLAAGAVVTYLVAARASGSIAAGLAGVALHVLLQPRFYNYPKVIVYALAIPLLWRFADRPTRGVRLALSALTAVAFLFRHDHGIFVAIAFATLLLLLTDLPWRVRVGHLLGYTLTTVLILSPYLLFVEVNGGIVSYFEQAAAWASRDRGRAPLVFPSVLLDGAGGPWSAGAWLGSLRANPVPWIFYLELLLPIVVLVILAVRRDAFRRDWPHARAKIATVAVLALVLDAGFLRSPLEARLADPSVPNAILLAWLAIAAVELIRPRAPTPAAWAVRGPMAAIAVAVLLAFALTLTTGITERFNPDTLRLTRIASVTEKLRTDWDPRSWPSGGETLLDLSRYLNVCTAPADRVLIQGYIPQVPALARRAFAGGHADLRPGFFTTEAAQQLTIQRLQHQSVPVILLESGEELDHFREEFPLVTAYIDAHYRVADTRTFDRFGTTLLVQKDRPPVGTYAPLGWPCYATGATPS